MIRALKVVIIIFAVIHILFGLALIFAPYQTLSMMGFSEIGAPAVYITALCGLTFVAASVWLIVAGRDPLRHLIWVKFAILWTLLGVAVQSYLVAQGVVNFSQARLGIIDDAVFAAAFLAFYPYRAARGR